MWNGPKWLIEQNSKHKSDVELCDTERRSFRVLWEIFTIAYEGYFGFTISTFLCLYQCPETRPYFGYSLFALYLYKAKSFLLTDTFGDSTDSSKLYMILFFYWPCYGGYCLLHALEK